jgi:hypothetical protein
MRCAVILLGFALQVGCNDPVLQQIERVQQGVCSCSTMTCAQDWLSRMPVQIPRARAKAEAMAQQTLVCFDKLSRLQGVEIKDKPSGF